MSPAPDLDGLSHTDLKKLVLELLGRVAELERLVAAQREEIARLKDLKGRPMIKPGTPSGMDSHTTPSGSSRKAGRRGRKASPLTIQEERVMRACVPAGSRFKGDEDFLVQDLVVRTAHAVAGLVVLSRSEALSPRFIAKSPRAAGERNCGRALTGSLRTEPALPLSTACSGSHSGIISVTGSESPMLPPSRIWRIS